MKKNRWLLSLLCIAAMFYLALPRLPLHEDGLAAWFAIAWIVFAVMAIGGNLAAIMYLPKRRRKISKLKLEEQKHIRLRQYT